MIARYRPPSQLLQSPALLSTESEDHLEQVREAIADEIKPRTIIEHMFVGDVADMSWEILRLRRCRTSIIAMAFRLALENILAEALRQAGEYAHQHQHKAQNLAYGWFSDAATKSEVRDLLRQFNLDESAIEAEAIRVSAADLELIDKLLASLEARRYRALRLIAEYRVDLAKLRTSSDRVIEGKVLAIEPCKGGQSPAAV
jgi:hypothetical protein